MKVIKTRETVQSFKVLDKPADLSKRMKDASKRTKGRADGAGQRQETCDDSPSGYAAGKVQGAAQGAAGFAAHAFPNPRKKALKNIENAGKRFEEVKRQLPKERKHAAEQAQKTAHKARSDAERLRKTADQAQAKAREAKVAVKDAKRTLKETRQSGRQTLREVRQKAKLDRGKAKARGKADGAAHSKPGAKSDAGGARGSASRPGYLNKGVSGSKGAGGESRPSAKIIKKTAKGKVKAAKKTVKTAERSARMTLKTAKRAAKTAQKTAQSAVRAAKAAEKAARAAAKAAVKAAKLAVRAAIALVKATVAAVRGIIALIAAGGWIAVLIIIIICLVAMLTGSVFGIFFSGGATPATGQTLNAVIAGIDAEYTGQLDSVIASNPHDLLDMSGARALWKNVLAVYTVRTAADPSNPMEVVTVDDAKAALLRAVFWDMNSITFTIDFVEAEMDELCADGLPTGGTYAVTTTVLRIAVTRKTVDEMAAFYGFADSQREWLEELLKPEYHALWNALLYGVTSIGGGSMIEIAETQLGNVGGETFWRWYGLSERDEWCAIFVSWCAYYAGHIDAGVLPMFASCAVGIEWFKLRGQWQDSCYLPAAGDLIFFDWQPDGVADHVGIVERIDGEHVHTIEGNASDSVRRRSYRLDSDKIFGYGLPFYG